MTSIVTKSILKSTLAVALSKTIESAYGGSVALPLDILIGAFEQYERECLETDLEKHKSLLMLTKMDNYYLREEIRKQVEYIANMESMILTSKLFESNPEVFDKYVRSHNIKSQVYTEGMKLRRYHIGVIGSNFFDRRCDIYQLPIDTLINIIMHKKNQLIDKPEQYTEYAQKESEVLFCGEKLGELYLPSRFTKEKITQVKKKRVKRKYPYKLYETYRFEPYKYCVKKDGTICIVGSESLSVIEPQYQAKEEEVGTYEKKRIMGAKILPSQNVVAIIDQKKIGAYSLTKEAWNSTKDIEEIPNSALQNIHMFVIDHEYVGYFFKSGLRFYDIEKRSQSSSRSKTVERIRVNMSGDFLDALHHEQKIKAIYVNKWKNGYFFEHHFGKEKTVKMLGERRPRSTKNLDREKSYEMNIKHLCQAKLSYNGEHVAIYNGNQIGMCSCENIRENKERYVWISNKGEPKGLACSGEGKYVSYVVDRKLYLYNMETLDEKELFVFQDDHEKYDIQLTHDDTYLFCGAKDQLVAFKLEPSNKNI